MKIKKSVYALSAALAATAITASIASIKPNQDGRGIDKPISTAKSNTPVKQLWHCGMHPQVIQDHPGFCPICHMALTPIGHVHDAGTMGAGGGISITIDPAVVQNMGVRTVRVIRGPLQRSIRAVAMVKLPEPGMHDVSLHVGGWIEKLYADQEGMHVVEGQPLFDFYSPDLQVAEQELIGAVKASNAVDGSAGGGDESTTLVESAKRKLRLWGIADQDIDAVAKADKPPETIPIRSPATGHIEDKSVVQGSAVAAMTKVMRVADHRQVWLEAQVYEDQINSVKEGQRIRATIEGMPGQVWDGMITFIYPHVDHMSRTLMVRMTVANPRFTLKPGMYATAQIALDPIDDAVQVPREAVIDTGTRQIAFVDSGEGHFEARRVQMGIPGEDGMVQIISGLAPGETVVTSGQFLLDAESRTIEAIATMSGSTQLLVPTTSPTSAPVSAPSAAPTSQQMLSVAYCPMAKASWLQYGSSIVNPYLGTAMSDCGSIQKTLAAPTDPHMEAVVKAYMEVGKALNADRVDASVLKELSARATELPGEKYAALQAAATTLAKAQDVKAARDAFHVVSDQLLSALSADSGEGAK